MIICPLSLFSLQVTIIVLEASLVETTDSLYELASKGIVRPLKESTIFLPDWLSNITGVRFLIVSSAGLALQSLSN